VAAHAKHRDDALDDGLSVITLDYDTMAPTLHRRDMVIVDRSIRCYVREGLYLMHNGAAEQVYRVHPDFHGGLDLLSDNPVYTTWRNFRPGDLDFRGKVVAMIHVVDPCGLRDARVRLAAGKIGGGDRDLERLAGEARS
jgi:phage repressor protein C with HTH and peptisase S24 domain